MPHPGLLHPEPLTLWQSTADLYLCRRHSNTVLAQSLWDLWVLVYIRLVSAPWVFQASMVFDSKCNFTLAMVLLGFLLCPWMWGIFFWWDYIHFGSGQSLSSVWLFATPWTAARQASLSITNFQSLFKHIHQVSGASIKVFSNESVLRIRWPKYWSFSFSMSPSNEYSGLISFRMDWLDLLAVQGTLKGLLQHHSSKASILWNSAFFIVQLSHLYMTTGKTIALTRRTFVGKVMSLLFSMPSRLVITFLPRSKCLNFMAVVTIYSDFGALKNEVCHCFHCFPI